MPQFLFYFASQNPEFRMPEIDSLAHLFGTTVQYDRTTDMSDNPYLMVEVRSEADAIKIAQRSVGLKAIFEVLSEGKNYEENCEALKAFRDSNPDRWGFISHPDRTFRFTVEAYGRHYSRQESIDRIEKYRFIEWKGKVNLKQPELDIWILEDCGANAPHDTPAKRVFFARLVSTSRRDLVETYSLKKRAYLGTTSMESEISFFTANQALARPGSLVIDPFVGTGSLVLTAAHFGARVIGADIDMCVLTGVTKAGKPKGKNLYNNFEQYGLTDRLVSLIRWDHSTRNCFRQKPMFDAIVCDPPYGVRAGAKKVGKKPKTLARKAAHDNQPHILEPPPNSDWHRHITQTVAYSVPDVLSDLLDFAARNLVIGGRLVYWLPTLNEQYKPSDVPQHPCLRLVANSKQPVSLRFSRHLITMQKEVEYDPVVHGNLPRIEYSFEEAVGHANFAMKYLRDPRRDDNRHNPEFAKKSQSQSDSQDDQQASTADQSEPIEPADFPNKRQKQNN